MTTDEKLRNAARRTLLRKVREGHIQRQPCEVCGVENADAHHDDYAKPLEVRWLCRAHHAEFHHPPLIRELGVISRRIRNRQGTLRTLETQRNALVRQALAEGWTHARISDATGLSRGRIGQIAHNNDKEQS